MASGKPDETTGPVILQVLPALGMGGVEQGTVDMAAAIARAGGKALVASSPGALLEEAQRAGGERAEAGRAGPLSPFTPFTHVSMAFSKSLSPLVFWARVRALRWLIRREGVSLVHARSRYPAWVAHVACGLEKTPLVTTWHGVHEARGPLKRLKRFYNSSLTRADRVIAVSSWIAHRLETDYGVDSARLRCIPRGSDPARFDPNLFRQGTPGEKRVQALRARWKIPADTAVILMPGRLTGWKGQTVLLEALALLAQKSHKSKRRGQKEPTDNWVGVFVGPGEDGPFGERLRNLAARLGVAARVRFVGPCADMPAAYALARVVAAPSLRPEPFGRIAVEAQLMARFVVASAHGGQAETVLSGKTGILLPPGDVMALATALEKALETGDGPEEIRREIGRRTVITSERHLARPSASQSGGPQSGSPQEGDAATGESAAGGRDRVADLYGVERMQAATLGVYDDLLGTALSKTFSKAFEATCKSGTAAGAFDEVVDETLSETSGETKAGRMTENKALGAEEREETERVKRSSERPRLKPVKKPTLKPKAERDRAERLEREARALRANLQRRKLQQRGMAARSQNEDDARRQDAPAQTGPQIDLDPDLDANSAPAQGGPSRKTER